ncbi:MAG: type II toxin-antitoxin system PrlF family antitoxin [Chloroflexota bacterium]|nr:type II toxin-antitoxin system PrlF family antitoxin [Chloroflexota bacterium]MDE2920720.1 type II toxin-antitoxin system PrlF family antitoxin [Chloroflexota bacterium]
MFESSITIKGQTTLPKAVRDSLAVKAGDKVRYVIVDEGVLVIPVRPTGRLFRSLKYDGPPVSVEEMDRAVAEGAIERWKQSTRM